MLWFMLPMSWFMPDMLPHVMGHDARRRVTSQDCRIDHPEDHRHVGHHEEGRHHRHVHPQTVLTTAAQDPASRRLITSMGRPPTR